MKTTVADALDAVDESRPAKRQFTSSKFDISTQQLSRKTNTKTNVIIVCPKSDDLKALNRKWHEPRNNSSCSFEIQRIIPGLNKNGTLYERPDLRNPNLKALNPKRFNPEDKASSAWRLGTFVLVVKGGSSEFRKVRNLYGDEEVWNARSLQSLHRPWGLPGGLPFDQNGVPLKIVFPKRDMSVREGGGRAFEAGEPLLVLTAPGEDHDVMLPVIDFEGYRGEIYKLDVFYGVVEVPWGVMVHRKWWQTQIDLFNEETRNWASSGLIQRLINTSNPLSTTTRGIVRKVTAKLAHPSSVPPPPEIPDQKTSSINARSQSVQTTHDELPRTKHNELKRKLDHDVCRTPSKEMKRVEFVILEDDARSIDQDSRAQMRGNQHLGCCDQLGDVDMENDHSVTVGKT